MIELNVPDMSCGHCVATITKTVQALDSGASVKADLATRSVSIETKADKGTVTAALEEAGYPSSVK